MAASSARSCISAVGGGIFAATRSIALSLSSPVRSPPASRTISPPLTFCARPGHASGAQRRGVRQRHVAVEAIHPHRMIRRDRVDPLASRQLAAPQLVVPVAARDPGAGRHRLRERRDARHELVARPGVAQLHRGQALPAVEEVHVRVDEAGDEELAAGIDDLHRRADGVRYRQRGCRISSEVPTAAMRSPEIATASAEGRSGSPVQTFALTMARVTGALDGEGAERPQAASRGTTSVRARTGRPKRIMRGC